MKLTALLATYNILSILGLDGVSEDIANNILYKTTEVVLKKSLEKAEKTGQITAQELQELQSITDSITLQNTLLQKLPNLKQTFESELTEIKKQALLKQVTDLNNYAKTKLGDTNLELQTKITEVCTKMLDLLNKDEVTDTDQITFDSYQKIRKSLNFDK